MSETNAEGTVQVSTGQQQETQVQNVSPFGREAWSEALPTPTVEAKPTTEPTTVQQEPTVTQESEEELLDPKDWLKREFEIDDPEVLKQQIKEYRELKEKPQTQAEIKFDNEQSKQLHELIREGKRKEVREFLETQERLESLTTNEVTKDNAVDIIKLQMKLSNKLLTDKDIEFQYKELYVAPKEPVQRTTETDEEFAERHEEWKERVDNIEQKKIVAAKMAIPTLEKLKTEIKLPELSKPEPTVQEPTQESLEAMKKARENFLAKLNSDYSKVEGFSTKVKDESVDIPISFKIPDEDKIAIKGMLEKGEFNVEDYFNKRWFDEKLNPNVERIFYDKYVLENLDKILSSVANNSANKRMEEYLKATKNLNVVTSTFTNQPTFQQNGNGQVSPFAKEAWSEKPPIVQN